MRHCLTVLPAILTMLICGTVWAQTARPAVHVEVILDSSGSMKDNDPKRLSALGAMIFTDLAADSDRLGLESMRQPRYTLEALSSVATKRSKIRSVAKSIKFTGTTDCAGPLNVASKALKGASDGKKFVIFLSDGACPNSNAGGSEAVRRAALELKRQNVKVFGIGLSSAGEQDLRLMADVTDGEFFRADKASDLPQRFADILGRIVGSEAVNVPIVPGKSSTISLDGYVRDASLIVTGSRPVRVTRATGPDGSKLSLPTKSAPYESGGSNFFVSANGNGAGSHYTVLRIDQPESGEWDFVIDAPRDAKAILIQNYALEPSLDLGAKTVATVGDTSPVRCELKGPDGKTLKDPSFLEKVGVELEVVAPDGKRTKTKMKLANFRFAHDLKIQQSGRYRLRARAFMRSGGLNKQTGYSDLSAIDFDLAFGEGASIDLGTLKAGETSKDYTLSMEFSRLAGEVEVDTQTQKLDGISVAPGKVKISPDKTDCTVRFEVSPDHPGGPVEGLLVMSSQGDDTSIPVRGNVVAITFWERWGETILLVGGGILALLLLLFIFYGFLSPYSFPEEARLNWGNTIERLEKNEVVIREIPKTGSGFYRNAQLSVGGPSSYFPVGGVELVTLEATSSTQVTITAAEGVELMRVNKFDHDKEKPVETGSTGMTSGEIFRAGEIYLRLR